MTDEELSGLARRVRQELDELQRILERINEGWERSRRSNDDYYGNNNWRIGQHGREISANDLVSYLSRYGMI